jgi:trigger factor
MLWRLTLSEALNITTAPRDDHQIEITIELGPERTTKALHRAARAVAQKARVPGFRPGKAPDATVFRTFGREKVLNEILNDLGEEVFAEALEISKLEPYGQASLTQLETDPIRFTLVIPLPPTVVLGDYSKIHVVPQEVNISDAQVDEVIERTRSEHATAAIVERPAQIGDTVVVDITGTVGEDTIMDNHDWELALKSEGGWLPGFDEAFVGMAAGEEKRFTLVYPEDSASRYKGQEAAFQAKVSAVKSQVAPEVTDEFARSLGDFADVADLRAKLLERMTAQRQRDVEEILTSEALDALVGISTIAYPPNVVAAETHAMLHEIERRVAEAGYKLEDYLRLQGLTTESYQERVRPQAEYRIKVRLAMGELILREAIEVSPEEVEAEVTRLLGLTSDSEDGQKTREMLSSPEGHAAIRQDMLSNKAVARLREIVTTGHAPELIQASAPVEAGDAASETSAPAVEVEPPAAPVETEAPTAADAPAEDAPSNE